MGDTEAKRMTNAEWDRQQQARLEAAWAWLIAARDGKAKA